MRILVPVGSRSEMGLSAPIIRRMHEAKLDVSTCGLTPGNFRDSYTTAEQFCIVMKPDWMLIVGDRIEMTAAACAAFHNNVKVAHYFAGILNDPIATLDDINRHCISLWADVHFVESMGCAKNVLALLNSIGKGANIHVVGITHMEDVVIDDSLVPNEPYYLILYNPITSYSKEENMEKMKNELLEIQECIGSHRTVFIHPNADRGNEAILEYFSGLIPREVPRPQFFGLLKYCEKFISNSSATVYEAPYFLSKKKIIKIGERNRSRPNDFHGYHASQTIVDVFKNEL